MPRKLSRTFFDGPITPTEAKVVDDLMLGHTNPQIAQSLGISIETVKTHLYRVFVKYGVENRTALVLAETERRSKFAHSALERSSKNLS